MDTLQNGRPAEILARTLPFRLRAILAADPASLEGAIAETRELGFDAALLPCPFETRDSLLWDVTRQSPAFGGGPVGSAVEWLRALRRTAGVALLADLPLDSIAAGSPLQAQLSDWFLPPDTAGVRDPRLPLDLGRARLRLDDAAATEAYARTLAEALAGLARAGLNGVRLTGLGHLPQATATTIIDAIRTSCPGAILIGDTSGAAWEQLAGMPAGTLDYVIASNAWWNWQDTWLFDELRLLRRIAPPLLSAEVTGDDPAAAVRDIGLAASVGAGWIVNAPPLGGRAAVQIRELNTALAATGIASALAASSGLTPLGAPGARALAVLRTPEPDPRRAAAAYLTLLNTDRARALAFDPATVLAGAQDMFGPFRRIVPAGGDPLVPGRTITLAPGVLQVFAADRLAPRAAPQLDPKAVEAVARRAPRIALERLRPAVDEGAFPVKRIAGEVVAVSADIIADGHDKLAAAVQWQGPDGAAWEEQRLFPAGNDLWQGSFPLMTVGLHRWRIVAWRDEFATFRDELGKKHAAGVPIALELVEGTELVRATLGTRPESAELLRELERADDEKKRVLLLSEETNALMIAADRRPHLSASREMKVDAERVSAGFAAWYEVFPRSLSDDPHRHGTFRDVVRHLPRIRDMGFDVLYFPPIHPIGRTNRKGPNNTLTPGPDDPGSPYAIGAAEGGHDALHPQLGSFDDLLYLREQAAAHGIEIALDFAIQCSPDHPWLREHKGWFSWRPDGTIRYAENPPKKYQDIVNVDFYARDAIPALWLELARIVLFWCDQGIRLFRVDNPHTKAFPFWEWMIAEVRARHPDAVFLAEAFTRPKVMQRLAKIGFSQSYTYFTWRNTKEEIREYLTELADGPMRDYFRPHFFVNTPDINPFFLQNTGRAAFLIRAALAATLSGLWGVYNGFELCEGTPLAPGKEEYLDSEKFQLRAWDWDRPGNIVAEIGALNRIRRDNPALRSHVGVSFLEAANGAILWYEKSNADRSNVLLVGVSVDPHNTQSAAIELPLWKFGLHDGATLELEDLLEGGRRFSLTGKNQTLTLDPARPYVIWRVAAH